MRKGRLIIVSAPSGTGKTVVVNRLLDQTDNMKRSVSVTTRPPRNTEKNGEDYFFISEPEFQRMVTENELLEWAQVHGYHYGTPRSFIESETDKGVDVVLVIDVQGAKQIRDKQYPAEFIFLKPPSWEELERRLNKRGTENGSIRAQRLDRAREELKHTDSYDRIVINDDLDITVETLKKILTGDDAHEE